MRGGKDKGFRTLLNEGPKTLDELPVDGFSPAQRQDGVTAFRPTTGGRGSSKSGGGMTQSVFYVHGKHEPKAVLEKWLEANETAVEQLGTRSIHTNFSQYGDEWKEASNELLDFEAYGYYSQEGYEAGGTCPLCGCEYNASLADHLPCDTDDR